MAIIISATVPIAMAPKANFFAAVLAGAVSIVTATIAVQSLHAALIALPASLTIDKLRQGQQLSEDARFDAAKRSYRAGRIFEQERYFSDAILAGNGLSPKLQRKAFDNALPINIVDSILKSAPASPHNWARRASFQLSTGDFEGALRSLETSLLLGRFVPGLTIPRLRLMLQYEAMAGDLELDNNIDEQIRIAARTEPTDLARFADGGAAEGRTQRALAVEFALYQPYIQALIRLRANRAVEQTAAVR